MLLLLVSLLDAYTPQKEAQFGFGITNDAIFTTDKLFTAANGFYYTFAHIPLQLSAVVDIYTPRREDLALSIPPAGVHPYGGFLYLKGRYLFTPAPDHIVGVAATVGATGEASGARYFQHLWHSIIGRPLYAGWDSQIASRLGVQATMEYHYILRMQNFLLIPIVDATLGNLQSMQSMGLRIWGGYSWDEPFVALYRSDHFVLNTYAQMQLRHIDWNIFLTGFEGYRYGVEPLPYQLIGVLGIEARWPVEHLTWGVLYETHFESNSYTTQEGGHAWAHLLLFVRY